MRIGRAVSRTSEKASSEGTRERTSFATTNRVEELESNSSTLGRRMGICEIEKVDMGVVAVGGEGEGREGRGENELPSNEEDPQRRRDSSSPRSLPSSSPPTRSMTIQDKHKKAASAKWKKSVSSSLRGSNGDGFADLLPCLALQRNRAQVQAGKTPEPPRAPIPSTSTQRARPLALANPLPSGRQNSDDEDEVDDVEEDGKLAGGSDPGELVLFSSHQASVFRCLTSLPQSR